jgi:hypothetical protein
MIEQGFVNLVQHTPAVAAIAVGGGGYLSVVPKGETMPTWTYTSVSMLFDYTLAGEHGLNMWRVQVDCYGEHAAECIRLAAAIDKVLSGFSGVLTDVDSTLVDSCFTSNQIDFFDDASKTYRRMIDYELWFHQ